ncbi:MAG: ABC transporter substrate-binding protein [Candidatus Riflebacteria bacterium]|nr:ABC transporter substrate-binding protein [Candidatus Riflebacteria bacterium]
MMFNNYRRGRIWWVIALILIISVISVLVRFESRPAINVAIVTKLESGTVVGSSEINTALFFLENHPDCLINIVKLNDNWDATTSREVVSRSINNGIQFFILSTPSSAAVASLDLFTGRNDSQALNINTSATTNAMSGLDDNSFRIVPDVSIEQQNIASYIQTLPGQNILVIQDSGNQSYTDPAFETFSQEMQKFPDKVIKTVKTKVADFDLTVLEPAFSEKYDILYILAGSYQQVIGNIAQFSLQHKPNAPIIVTPWARTPSVLQTAGPAAEKIILPSQFPSRFEDEKIRNFLERFKKRFNYEPYSMSLGVYQALEILRKAFQSGHKTPETVKKFLEETKTFETSLGKVDFDKFGDQVAPLYFITSFRREFE